MYTTQKEFKGYYYFRKAIRELYKNDVQTGDLCCKILEIRDKYRYVESISVALQDYTIEVEFTPGTEEDKKLVILDKIATLIGYYISDNQDLLPSEVKNDHKFEIFLESENHMYCDICLIGDTLTFNL